MSGNSSDDELSFLDDLDLPFSDDLMDEELGLTGDLESNSFYDTEYNNNNTNNSNIMIQRQEIRNLEYLEEENEGEEDDNLGLDVFPGERTNNNNSNSLTENRTNTVNSNSNTNQNLQNINFPAPSSIFLPPNTRTTSLPQNQNRIEQINMNNFPLNLQNLNPFNHSNIPQPQQISQQRPLNQNNQFSQQQISQQQRHQQRNNQFPQQQRQQRNNHQFSQQQISQQQRHQQRNNQFPQQQRQQRNNQFSQQQRQQRPVNQNNNQTRINFSNNSFRDVVDSMIKMDDYDEKYLVKKIIENRKVSGRERTLTNFKTEHPIEEFMKKRNFTTKASEEIELDSKYVDESYKEFDQIEENLLEDEVDPNNFLFFHGLNEIPRINQPGKVASSRPTLYRSKYYINKYLHYIGYPPLHFVIDSVFKLKTQVSKELLKKYGQKENEHKLDLPDYILSEMVSQRTASSYSIFKKNLGKNNKKIFPSAEIFNKISSTVLNYVKDKLGLVVRKTKEGKTYCSIGNFKTCLYVLAKAFYDKEIEENEGGANNPVLINLKLFIDGTKEEAVVLTDGATLGSMFPMNSRIALKNLQSIILNLIYFLGVVSEGEFSVTPEYNVFFTNLLNNRLIHFEEFSIKLSFTFVLDMKMRRLLCLGADDYDICEPCTRMFMLLFFLKKKYFDAARKVLRKISVLESKDGVEKKVVKGRKSDIMQTELESISNEISNVNFKEMGIQKPTNVDLFLNQFDGLSIRSKILIKNWIGVSYPDDFCSLNDYSHMLTTWGRMLELRLNCWNWKRGKNMKYKFNIKPEEVKEPEVCHAEARTLKTPLEKLCPTNDLKRKIFKFCKDQVCYSSLSEKSRKNLSAFGYRTCRVNLKIREKDTNRELQTENSELVEFGMVGDNIKIANCIFDDLVSHVHEIVEDEGEGDSDDDDDAPSNFTLGNISSINIGNIYSALDRTKRSVLLNNDEYETLKKANDILLTIFKILKNRNRYLEVMDCEEKRKKMIEKIDLMNKMFFSLGVQKKLYLPELRNFFCPKVYPIVIGDIRITPEEGKNSHLEGSIGNAKRHLKKKSTQNRLDNDFEGLIAGKWLIVFLKVPYFSKIIRKLIENKIIEIRKSRKERGENNIGTSSFSQDLSRTSRFIISDQSSKSKRNLKDKIDEYIKSKINIQDARVMNKNKLMELNELFSNPDLYNGIMQVIKDHGLHISNDNDRNISNWNYCVNKVKLKTKRWWRKKKEDKFSKLVEQINRDNNNNNNMNSGNNEEEVDGDQNDYLEDE